MIQSLLIAVGGVVGLMVLWVVIQSLWRKTFSAEHVDEDALAGRTKCGNCGCTTICHDSGRELTAMKIK